MPEALQLVPPAPQPLPPSLGINRRQAGLAQGPASGRERPAGNRDRALKARGAGEWSAASQPSSCLARVITGWRWKGRPWARASR